MFLPCVALFITGCFSASTSDPEEAFRYWSGTDVPDNIQVINGQYYQSPHFTLEYELFLELRITEDWWAEFVATNGLERDHQNYDWQRWTELPDWFRPDKSFVMYSKNEKGDRSRYLFNPLVKTFYVYETVGM